jgi:hypothetical protein
MAITYDEVVDRIQGIITAATGTITFPRSDLDFAVETAIAWHSRIKPYRAVQVGTGDGSTNFVPLEDQDLIRVRRVEYPYGTVPPSYLDGSDWQIHRGTAGLEVVFITAPGSGDTYGIHYSGMWGTATLTSSALMPLAYLACAHLSMRQAATFGEGIDDGIIEASGINYGSKARDWLQIKDHFAGLYAATYGLTKGQVLQGAPPPAYGIGSVPSERRYQRYWW